MRPGKDEYYIGVAYAVSRRSTCLRKHYGAVIVKNDRIISTGYNGSPRGEENCCDTGVCYRESCGEPRGTEAKAHGCKYGSCVAVHAEQNAIIAAKGEDMAGATLYLFGMNADGSPLDVVAPCNICDRMIKNAGIARIVVSKGETHEI